ILRDRSREGMMFTTPSRKGAWKLWTVVVLVLALIGLASFTVIITGCLGIGDTRQSALEPSPRESQASGSVMPVRLGQPVVDPRIESAPLPPLSAAAEPPPVVSNRQGEGFEDYHDQMKAINEMAAATAPQAALPPPGYVQDFSPDRVLDATLRKMDDAPSSSRIAPKPVSPEKTPQVWHRDQAQP